MLSLLRILLLASFMGLFLMFSGIGLSGEGGEWTAIGIGVVLYICGFLISVLIPLRLWNRQLWLNYLKTGKRKWWALLLLFLLGILPGTLAFYLILNINW